MSAIREQIRVKILALTIPKNSYELSMADADWIYANLDLSARNFILGLLERKFNKTKKRFGTDAKLALACREIVSKAKYEFEKHPLDKRLWVAFRKGHRARPKKILLSYRQLWRGYSEDEIKPISRTIWRDKTTFQNALDKALRRNSVLLRRANKAGYRARIKAYDENEVKLQEIKKIIENAFTQDPELLARRKLIHRTHYRRGHTLGIITTPDDYLRILFFIQRHNPDLIEFPLRFMGYLPCTTYDALGRKWLKGCTRDEMMLALIGIEGNSIPDICNRLFAADEILAEQLGCRRSVAFKEIADTYEAGHYIAATLLATTQTEGVLWDFARYLNRRNIRVFKQGHLPSIRWSYPWDRKKNKYTKVNPKTKRPMYKKDRLISSGGLLEKTRIGSFISPELISYLVDDFIQDRNPLAHGTLEDRDYKPSAIAAINCLMACLYEIAKYLGKVES